MRAVCLVLASVSLATTSARADFVVRNSTTLPTPTETTTDPPTPTAAKQSADAADAATQPAPDPPRFKMAYGFGDQVPLGFACQQIVPRAVRVTYGPGANPHQLVTWRGGDTWNRVLRTAVRALGLSLVMTHMAVEIRQ